MAIGARDGWGQQSEEGVAVLWVEAWGGRGAAGHGELDGEHVGAGRS